MSATAADNYPGPTITPDDRLGMTICLAIIVHAMVVLGISFAPEPSPESRFEALEIILVPEKSEQAPDDADLLSQANLVGGGDSDVTDPPATPVKAPLPAETADIAASSAPPVPPTPPPSENQSVAPAQASSPQKPQSAEKPAPEELVTAAPEAIVPLADNKPEAPETPDQVTPDQSTATPEPPADQRPLPTAAQLLTRSFALASINAELEDRLDSRSKRPRRKYISANTREYRYAAYMEAWRAKVERVGNLNYPDEARRKQLSGNLLLDVALNSDGSVRKITVRRSSGHKLLDDAAVRIVELAAPFAAFPDDIRKEVDILHVTRTWKFLDSQGLTAR